MNDLNDSLHDGIPTPSVLLIQVTSSRGFIPALGTYFDGLGADLLSLEEYRIQDTLFVRCECHLPSSLPSSHVLGDSFKAFLSSYGARAEVIAKRSNGLAGLILGQFSPILERILLGLSSRESGRASTRNAASLGISFIAAMDVDNERIANRYGIPFFVLPKKDGLSLETKCQELIKRYRPGVVGVAGMEHAFSAGFHATLDRPLFGVQSGFVPVESGSPRVRFDFAWAQARGARVVVGSSYLATANVSEHLIVEQQARALSTDINESKLSLIHADLEADLFLETLSKLNDHRVFRQKDRCIVF